MLENYPDILKVEDVASILRVSSQDVNYYLKHEALRSFRFKYPDGREGRRRWVPKQALIEYMEGPNE
jgi:hypothetical protein